MRNWTQCLSVILPLLALVAAALIFSFTPQFHGTELHPPLVLEPISWQQPTLLSLNDDSWGFGGNRAEPQWKELMMGNALARECKPFLALKHWGKLIHKYPDSEIELAALENMALWCRFYGYSDLEIMTYNRILARKSSAWHPISITSMPTLNDYHYACTALSDLWLERGNGLMALRYAELAVTEYPFSDWCGNAALSEQMAVIRRISALRSAMSMNVPVRIRGPRIANR